MRILIAEDDANLLKSLKHVFTKSNFIVDGVDNGADALDYALTGSYDAVIMDIMMPEMDGVQVLRELRRKNMLTPILFLTAKSEIEHRVEGLDAGADDYLTKPFAVSELLARTRAMLRRKDNYTPELLEFNSLLLNRSTYQLAYGDCLITLSTREYQLMEMFMLRPGAIIKIDDIITNIWGWDADMDNSTVWVHMSNLRKRLKKMSAPFEIKFIRGAGYMLCAEQEKADK